MIISRGMMMGLVVMLVLAGMLGTTWPTMVEASDRAWVGKVVSLQGRAMVQHKGRVEWVPLGLNDTLIAGDQIRVAANSRAGIVLRNDTVIRLDQHTTLVFTDIESRSTFLIKMLKGAASFFSRRPRSLKISTPFVNGVVEGTEFYVQVDADQTRIDLFEGRILAENSYGELQLGKGQGLVASANVAPLSHLLVHPRDSVQWALYYPPILALGADDVPEALTDSLAKFNQGQPDEAITDLEGMLADSPDAAVLTYGAGLMLHVGRVNEARYAIQQALALDPKNSDALALMAIIEVVQNRKESALSIALDAVQRNARSVPAQIALSYAFQAGFKLSEALNAAKMAVAQAPENSAGWARLAEVQLSTGALDGGIRSAQKAAALNPNDAHAHALLGFAYLTQIKTQKARGAFDKAIALDSAAPLPRLGLGLAKIRDGELTQGRAQIEIAAGLDPVNALIRSYLGKAYFDEKRGPLDAKQLDIAKTLDPKDPTPWFYDAIRKQSINRPVEALNDLRRSKTLNDNRAVYRSRLLLDEDLATRSTGIGRIYNDLDFQQLALKEGYQSLRADTTNYSAHRLLADSYAAKPRHEIARVSELLQAQLFQPMNLNPIQARLTELDTSFLDNAGPGALSLNEYDSLFTRNRIALQASGLGASNKTTANELTASGVFDKVSASVGAFKYQTDGMRENNDYGQDVVDLLVQAHVTSKTNLQLGYRHSAVENGDRSQNFDGGFSSDFREKVDVDKFRIGAHHVFSQRFESVLSCVLTDLELHQSDLFANIPGSSRILDRQRDGYLVELRNDYKTHRFSLITGAGYLDEDLEEASSADLGPPMFIPVVVPGEIAEITKSSIYAYSYYRPSEVIELTVGFSADWLERGQQIDTAKFNPKLGLSYRPHPNTTLRLAAFKVLSNTNLAAQTVEPTHIAGFNQFYDDLYGSEVWNFSAGVSHEFSDSLFGGMELSKRDLEVPQFSKSPVPAVYYPWEEYVGSAYLYWVPCDTLAINAGYQYEDFDRGDNPISRKIRKVTTHKFPIGVKYFHPTGFSFGLKTTYISQRGTFQPSITTTLDGDDNFWITDVEMSYRLPDRFGILSVGAKNLFDEEVNYQDTDSSNPTISEDRSIFAKVNLSF